MCYIKTNNKKTTNWKEMQMWKNTTTDINITTPSLRVVYPLCKYTNGCLFKWWKRLSCQRFTPVTAILAKSFNPESNLSFFFFFFSQIKTPHLGGRGERVSTQHSHKRSLTLNLTDSSTSKRFLLVAFKWWQYIYLPSLGDVSDLFSAVSHSGLCDCDS